MIWVHFLKTIWGETLIYQKSFMTSGNILKRREWEYSGGLIKHELNVLIVLLFWWRVESRLNRLAWESSVLFACQWGFVKSIRLDGNFSFRYRINQRLQPSFTTPIASSPNRNAICFFCKVLKIVFDHFAARPTWYFLIQSNSLLSEKGSSTSGAPVKWNTRNLNILFSTGFWLNCPVHSK